MHSELGLEIGWIYDHIAIALAKTSPLNQHAPLLLQEVLCGVVTPLEHHGCIEGWPELGQKCMLVRVALPELRHVTAAVLSDCPERISSSNLRSCQLALSIAVLQANAEKGAVLINNSRQYQDYARENLLWMLFEMLGLDGDVKLMMEKESDAIQIPKPLENNVCLDGLLSLHMINNCVPCLTLAKSSNLCSIAGQLLQASLDTCQKAETLFEFFDQSQPLARLALPGWSHVVAGGGNKRSIMVALVVAMSMRGNPCDTSQQDLFKQMLHRIRAWCGDLIETMVLKLRAKACKLISDTKATDAGEYAKASFKRSPRQGMGKVSPKLSEHCGSSFSSFSSQSSSSSCTLTNVRRYTEKQSIPRVRESQLTRPISRIVRQHELPFHVLRGMDLVRATKRKSEAGDDIHIAYRGKDVDVLSSQSEEEWDSIETGSRTAFVAQAQRKKKACDATRSTMALPMPAGIVTISNFPEKVWALQDSIRPAFQDGRTLDQLVVELRRGDKNPLTCDSLILNVAVANLRDRSGMPFKRYYTLDHRRLWCMRQAGCTSIRVRIKPELSGPAFDQFLKKAHMVGRHVDDLTVRQLRHGKNVVWQ